MKPLLFALVCSSVLLAACGEEETKIEEIDKGRNEHAGTVSHDETYSFDLEADESVYRLEDDIEELEIEGDGNYVTITSDSLVDLIIIKGNNNVVDSELDHSTTVVDVEVSGNSNLLRLYDVANTTLDGTDNLVVETQSTSSP